MKMRWVVTFKGNGQLKARLVVEGFTNQRLGKIPTSSRTASRRSPQMFRTLAASLGFQTNKGAAKCAFLQSDMDEQHVNDNDDDDFNIEPTQPVSDTFCELDPALSRKLQKEHHTSVFACRKAVYVLLNAPRRRDIIVLPPIFETREAQSGLSKAKMVSFRPSVRRTLMTLCWRAVASSLGKRIFDGNSNLYEWGTWESRVFTHLQRTNHTSLRPTHRNMARI